MKTIKLLLLLLLFSTVIIAQQTITGNVKTAHNNEQVQNLPGATVMWLGTTVAVTTDFEGNFSIPQYQNAHEIVISYVGYKSDTICTHQSPIINIILQEDNNIGSVIVNHHQNGSYTSDDNSLLVKTITTSGLQQLPCCNLSESFENSADVDVSFSDAISGAKQIQMLGLAGIYSQLLTENIPSIRGLATPYGLAYIPGSWMQSIQISKGVATVINGYESITGQINVELKKPNNSEKLFINLFGNSMGRTEFNANSSIHLSDNLSTMFLVHGSIRPFVFDGNNDGFADQPLTKQFNIINRWKLSTKIGVESQIGFKAMNENRSGGQIEYLNTKNNTDFYGIGINTKRYEGFYKLGSTINFIKDASVGSTFSWFYHDQKSFYGHNNYSGLEKSFYGNIIFEKKLFSDKHKLNFGTSLLLDNFSEYFNKVGYQRNEMVPGTFIQYTFEIHEKFSSIIGFRTDFHNIYGQFNTFRGHLKYHLTNTSTIRASAGKGYRVANILAENVGYMTSSRFFEIDNDLKPEEAWNYGISLNQAFNFSVNKSIKLGIDYFRTDFINQVVVDANSDYSKIMFYNLDGKSFSNSFQTNATFEFWQRLVITSAFRYNDVQITMHDELIEKPLVSKYKGLLTLSYSTKESKWVFDLTNQFVGKTKLPSTTTNPIEYQLGEYSPAFFQLHGQISRKIKQFEIYVGGENLTNYKQTTPIIAADNPYGDFFDASIVWGPIIGRRFYAGIRLTIE